MFASNVINESLMISNIHVYKPVITRAGSRPMQMHRSEKIADAFIGQIFTANNKKQHFLRKHKAYNEQISTKLLFLEMSTKHILKFTSERVCSPENLS